ncbi:hypothetical protein GCM10009730_57150 [Streptomyces albidochromogenes]|uniref:hypothetical protein n=1 Tax=Streptomyces albidochromogenes TaxID=329524 RepID=UPI00110FB418|nr:hypothetical protein [Streptomyces albidochromogenes]
MDPRGLIAKRLPLVARFRPACLALPARVRALVDLAATAVREQAQGNASAVYNQAALIASDLGATRLAQKLCHQHAAAFLQASPLTGESAIRGLEPVVNLARLQIRAGRVDEGRQCLQSLYEAVEQGVAARFGDVVVPADLTVSDEDRHEVLAWLWRVLLADGTRTLTTVGRWTEALAHIEKHRGLGRRMLDGRQVAVLAALTSGETKRAAELLVSTAPGDPWEQAVTASLTVLCRRDAKQPVKEHLHRLVDTFLKSPTQHGMTVFEIRLGLTILDTMCVTDPDAGRIVAELHRRTVAANDGYAARENLTHPLFAALATLQQMSDCRNLVSACRLGAGTFSGALHDELMNAVNMSDRVIRNSLRAIG